MKKLNPNYLAILLIGCQFIYGQKVAFEEYDLENGLHVILHRTTQSHSHYIRAIPRGFQG